MSDMCEWCLLNELNQNGVEQCLHFFYDELCKILFKYRSVNGIKTKKNILFSIKGANLSLLVQGGQSYGSFPFSKEPLLSTSRASFEKLQYVFQCYGHSLYFSISCLFYSWHVSQLGTTTLSIKTLSIGTLSTKGLFVTLSTKGLFVTLSIKGLFVKVRINDTQKNWHSAWQHSAIMFSVIMQTVITLGVMFYF